MFLRLLACLLEGRLYPVNERAARTISNLYAGNERVSLMIDKSSCYFQCFPDDIFVIIDFVIEGIAKIISLNCNFYMASLMSNKVVY